MFKKHLGTLLKMSLLLSPLMFINFYLEEINWMTLFSWMNSDLMLVLVLSILLSSLMLITWLFTKVKSGSRSL